MNNKHSKNKIGPLLVETPFLFSFGVTEKNDLDGNKFIGYTLPICLWKQNEKLNSEEKCRNM